MTGRGESVPNRRSGVDAHLGDGVHVLRRRDGYVEYVLNETALALWQLCDGRTGPDEMVDSACELFDADREVVAADVRRALAAMTDAGLLEWPEASATSDGGLR